MLKPNKDELSRQNNLIVEANDRITRAKAEIEQYMKQLAEAEEWIESHMKICYPTGGQVFLPKEQGRGAMVIVRRLEDNVDSHEQDRYVVERLSCD